MQSRVLVWVTVGLLLAADNPKDDVTAKELKSLQGAWTPVSVESGGVKATAEQLTKVAGKLEVEGDRITLEVWSTPSKASLRVDPTQKPKTMDWVKDGKTTCLAIYELDGDCLRICFQVEDGKPRPGEFTSKGAFVIFAYQRNRP
jgi:uncharacterized protein (TIGR03067 family)